jgi:hypothetical protein
MITANNVRYGPDRLDQAAFDAEVARLHGRRRDDRHIAFALGVHRKTVATSRRRQHLDPWYGPAGRPWKQVAA